MDEMNRELKRQELEANYKRLHQEGKYKELIDLIQNNKITPLNEDSVYWLMLSYFNLGKLENVIEIWNKNSKYENNAGILTIVGAVLIKYKSTFKLGYRFAAKALKLKPWSRDGTCVMARALIAQGKIKEALNVYKQYEKLSNSIKVHSEMLSVAHSAGDNRTLCRWATQQIRDNESTQAYRILIKSLRQQRRMVFARNVAERAYKKQENGEFKVDYMLCSWSSGRKEIAKDIMYQIIREKGEGWNDILFRFTEEVFGDKIKEKNRPQMIKDEIKRYTGCNSIVAFGDSHIKTLQGGIENEIVYTGPGTAFALSNKERESTSRKRIIEILDNREMDNDGVILLFGDIDVMRHVGRQAMLKTISTEEILDKIIESYIKFVIEIKEKVCWVCIVSPFFSSMSTTSYLDSATRNNLIKIMQTKLEAKTESLSGIYAVGVSDLTISSNNMPVEGIIAPDMRHASYYPKPNSWIRDMVTERMFMKIKRDSIGFDSIKRKSKLLNPIVGYKIGKEDIGVVANNIVASAEEEWLLDFGSYLRIDRSSIICIMSEITNVELEIISENYEQIRCKSIKKHLNIGSGYGTDNMDIEFIWSRLIKIRF